ILSGKQALEAGLVDSLGNYYDAIDTVKEIAGIKGDKPSIRTYPSSGLQDKLSDLLSTSLTQAIPGLDQAQRAAQWKNVPLALWE
ncbi:MAG: hypothetical protein AAGB01_11655, partial [Cyanobacteria bacterium P01_F01_bin.42]